jgi:L-aminopeptidase/D-esterase-like protein
MGGFLVPLFSGDSEMSLKVPGIKIGHAQDKIALTGCTVVLCEGGAVCGIDKRGGGTTTRQADAFEPWHVVDKVYGVLLTGGSAFGLGALSGVLDYLEERELGFDMRVAKVPIVASAGLFDLSIGDASVRPDPKMAYRACVNASAELPTEGCVGAGTGATVGKIAGTEFAMKSGIGIASIEVTTELIVEAIVAVNAGGDIVDPSTGHIIAGVRSPNWHSARTREEYFANSLVVLKRYAAEGGPPFPTDNTVIGVITTNATMTKVECTKVAQMAQDGLARTVRPAHTMFDGDTIFALATGGVYSEVSLVGAFAAEAFAQAIINATRAATSGAGLPAAPDAPGI